ncbi:MAG: rhomboid family intramembrane serine protease [Alphaproteobacteria bacterium]|nr:rhomboid family intramembrane serine protease [Alphaproteobacteria bacterium]
MAFFHPGPARQPAFNVPAVVLGLIAFLAAAHGLRMALPPAQSADIVSNYALIPARLLFAGSIWDKAVPFVSYMAIHGDWAHVGINCLWLLAFGPIVARRFGALLFLLFFLICGISAAALFLAFDWGGAEPVVGASGAISGLMAAAIRLMPARFPWVQPGEAPMAPLLSRQVLSFSAIWVVLNAVVGILGLGLVPAGQAIAWQAHLGGYCAGLLLAGLFDSVRPKAPTMNAG